MSNAWHFTSLTAILIWYLSCIIVYAGPKSQSHRWNALQIGVRWKQKALIFIGHLLWAKAFKQYEMTSPNLYSSSMKSALHLEEIKVQRFRDVPKIKTLVFMVKGLTVPSPCHIISQSSLPTVIQCFSFNSEDPGMGWGVDKWAPTY